MIEHHQIDLAGGEVQTSYSADDGYAYWLETTDDLTEGIWLSVEGAYFEADEAGPQTFITDAAGGDSAFYRVVRVEL